MEQYTALPCRAAGRTEQMRHKLDAAADAVDDRELLEVARDERVVRGGGRERAVHGIVLPDLPAGHLRPLARVVDQTLLEACRLRQLTEAVDDRQVRHEPRTRTPARRQR